MLIPTSKKTVESGTSPKRITIFGSTGSIGRSALEVVRQFPDRFEVVGLAAGSQADLLADQIAEFRPHYAALADERAAERLVHILGQRRIEEVEVLRGAAELRALAGLPKIDLMLAAIVGIAGLESVVEALRSGTTVALANKESLVCGGELVRSAAAAGKASIIPVDSEHSAIFQVLHGTHGTDIERIILTASGGPFRSATKAQLSRVTPEEALQHPTWSMGPKVTIDSATMMNKALEVIEAHWLFGLAAEQISVLIHPQSIVHSLIELVDGSQLAQLSVPDMKGAIAYALSYPGARLAGVMQSLSLAQVGKLTFEELDPQRFPAVELAQECIRRGSAESAAFSIANEEAVAVFLAGRIHFTEIVPRVARLVEASSGRRFSSFAELQVFETEVRRRFQELG